jgi:hypothetical protein
MTLLTQPVTGYVRPDLALRTINQREFGRYIPTNIECAGYIDSHRVACCYG